MTSVLVVDDHPIVLQGCRRILEEGGAGPVLEASDLVTGYRLFRRHRPDVVVLDLALQDNGLGGLELIRRLRLVDPRTRILVFSMHGDPIIVSRALQAGATGYLNKDTAPDELVTAFNHVRNGRAYINHRLAMEVAVIGTSERSNPLSELTPRELQTLSLLSKAKRYEAIAEELHVSYKTVANTCTSLKQKLGVNTLPELVRRAMQCI